jgi:hypothetical protein
MPLNNFDYQLSWSDFSALPRRPAGVNEDAQIHPEMGFSNFKLASKGRAVTIADVDIDITLVRSDCWSVEKAQSEGLLKHEQGHYDILALSAREFYKSVKSLTAKSSHELQRQVTALADRMARRVKTIDETYDTETKHNRDTTSQQSWLKKIAVEKQKADGSIDNLK